ncbi:MAG: tyrosine-type recombinase/integrase [Alphaproteobacteria bacterium]
MTQIPLSLQQAIESGKCVLFLGAGIGGHLTTNGKPLPNGWELAQELCKKFDLEAKESYQLPLVSRVVELKKGRKELESYIHKRLSDAQPDEDLQWLLSLNWRSIAAYKILERNPVRIIAETKSGYPIKRRRTYIKPHQLPAWWEAVEDEETDTSRDYLLLVLFTGLRRSEACRLKWSDIDLIGKTLSLEDSKNGEPLTLPLSRFLLNLLENRHKRYGNYEYVFPGDGEHGHYIEPKKSVYRVGKRSGIHFTIHDLRRTFITIAESLDISAYALKRLINHKITNDITGGYIIVDVERLREPVEKIAQTILGYKDGVSV